MILIKSAQIIDGTGKAPFKGDILIKGDKISAIGNFSHKKAEIIIDGLGLVITPGFIDVNANSDHYLSLFDNPTQPDFLFQGVTTIIGGQCGASLAPLLEGSLKSLRKWGDTSKINVDWTKVGEFKKILNKLKIGINFGTLAGHSTIRRDIIGEEVRDLTEPELEVFKKVLTKSLRDGALGLSTGLGYALAKNTPYFEIKKLLSVLASKGGVYVTHLRSEKENIVRAVDETLKITEETGVPTIISHLRPFAGFENEFNEAFALIEERLNKGNIYFDVNPFNVSISPAYTLLPSWAQHGNLESMFKILNDHKYKKQIIEELSKIKNQLKETLIAGARNNDILIGKTLKEFAESRGVDVREGLLILLEITGMKALLFRKNINKQILSKILLHPRALIGSNSASLLDSPKHLKSRRSVETFTEYLKIALSKNIILEEAVRRITSMPAKIFKIKKRGIVKEGWFADLVMMKNNKIINVLVNGEVAVKDGKLFKVLSGKAI